MSGTGSNEKKELMVVTTQSSDEEKSFHRENKNGKLQNHPLQDFMWKGVMCFLVIVASVLCAFIIVHISDVMKAFHALMNILQPILVGLVFAYLLNPIMKWFEKIFFKISKKSPEDKKAKKRIRSISLILSIVFAVVIITVIIYAVLPDLLISITNLVRDMPGHVNTFAKWIGSLSINEKYDDLIQDAVISAEKYIENWIKTDLLGKMDTFFSRITVGVVGVINVLENVFIGLIVSIYVLSTKEKFKGQTKKLLYAVFPKKTTENILELARDSDRIFLGFLSGKIIDSWRTVLYYFIYFKYAIYFDCKCDCWSDKHYSIFWTIYRRRSKCNTNFSCKSKVWYYFHYCDCYFTAVRWKLYWTKDFRRLNRAICILGYLCHYAWIRFVWLLRNDIWCSYFWCYLSYY